MTFTYSLSTSVGKVRNLIGDTSSTSYLLSDEEISSLISLASDDLFTAGAMALRRIAATKASEAKAITAGDYSENGTGLYKAYLDAADRLEQMAKDTPAEAQVEVIVNDFSFNSILRNRVLRGENIDE